MSEQEVLLFFNLKATLLSDNFLIRAILNELHHFRQFSTETILYTMHRCSARNVFTHANWLIHVCDFLNQTAAMCITLQNKDDYRNMSKFYSTGVQ